MDPLTEHVHWDIDCYACDKPAMQCLNCGGVVHFTIFEKFSSFYGPMVMETVECDTCGEDYVLEN